MSRRNARQAKLEKTAKKASKKEHREAARRKLRLPLSASLLSGLDEAHQLLEDGNLEQAVDVLEELQRRYPRRAEVLGLLLDACSRQQDMWSYQAACQRFLKANPDDPDVWMALAGSAVQNGQVVTAHAAFRHFLNRWPNHQLADDRTRDVCDELEAFLLGEIAQQGLRQDDGFQLLELHDEINFHLHRGDDDLVCQTAKRLLVRWPTFAPALNNRSQAYFRSGRIPLAIGDARRVLEFDADNYHALANLTRYLFLSGEFEEAAATAERLNAIESTVPDYFVKRAESLAFLADWSGVLAVLEQAESCGAVHPNADVGLLYHLAGVAAAELGRFDAARKHWKRVVKWKSLAPWTQQNLDDLKRPIGEQNGPWAFPLEYWIPKAVFDLLIGEMKRVGPRSKEGAVGRGVRNFFTQYPHLEKLLPRLLEQGDPTAKEFVVRIASLLGLPSIMSALRDFAFGRRGTDALRHQALTVLIEAGILAHGRHRMWIQGQLRDVNCMAFEITPEPLDPLPTDVEQLAADAQQAIHNDDGATAESLLNEALRLYPDHPSLAYNRAVAIEMQGRGDEAMRLVREIHARLPDYLFARVRLAEDAVGRRDFDAARTLLEPLMARSRLHLSEYAALCHAHIALLSAEGEVEGARSWLKMWEDVDPRDPRLKTWKARLGRRGLWGKLFRSAAAPDLAEE